jgi:hypothetical protein
MRPNGDSTSSLLIAATSFGVSVDPALRSAPAAAMIVLYPTT